MSTISAIICVNNKKYELKKSLESIREQTVLPEEIIVVDFSSDNTCKDFLDSYTDLKVKYIPAEKKDTEPFDEISAFETGLKYASCDYAAFMAPGDVWSKNKISVTKDFLSRKDSDVIISSYEKYFGFDKKSFILKDSSEFSYGLNSLFMFWYAPSAVVIKRKAAIALNALSSSDFAGLKIGVIPECLSTIFSGVDRDSLIMEKLFWEKFYPRINAMDIVQEAALFCIKHFQNEVKSRESLALFAKTVELSPEDVVKAVFGADEFSKSGGLLNAGNSSVSSLQQEKFQQNYLLMRNWLELKLYGSSVAENLKKKSVNSVIIFGAGKHGSILFNDLKTSDIKVLGWLDNNPRSSDFLGYPVYTPLEFSKKNIKADGIIITPYLDYDEIAEDLSRIGLKNLISLKDIVR
ncbi:MAG: glycosyltransferase [Treponema sp.]|nr:glycosyltransferase [Treponema sp.]